ncbi:DNA polymerase IV [Pelobacter propionicus]|uniref:DNA polymerase IV n=1 Tax=Pelobacter propionicus (strain DSM 2379 / NBRC 103807 / OttBd1) TaxID=338966 RepID=A1AQ94_PELPD|nr:DNA polymerase IV [Pelobacter propionicus]ABK99514.1 DNA-directed DNA polymerase [Pelobacter propionicus DSM 2379]
MEEQRIVIHNDMNAFFASVEQQANPELRGKPIAVVGGGGRTVITTSSYEARAFGVKTGMAKWEALRVCPQLIIVVGDNKKYTYTSARIMEMMKEYTPLVEVFSIDEAWMDITHSLSIFGTPERIAYLLKARIKESFGITCSIGIAPNKLLAKLASDLHKPDGLTVIKPEEVSRVLERMPIKELCGIGKKTEYQLKVMNINTCGELGRCDESRLTRKFGIIGSRLKQMGQGIDDSPVTPNEEDDEVKSVGHSMTLRRDVERREDILKYLLQLSEMVGRRARRYGVSGKTVTLHVRFADFYSSFGKQNTLKSYINLSDDIFKAAVAILDTTELPQPVRQLGVKLSNLKYQAEQLSLFRDVQKKSDAIKAMDAVNDRYGEFKVTFGSLLQSEDKGSHVISPAWRPEGIRNVDVQ